MQIFRSLKINHWKQKTESADFDFLFFSEFEFFVNISTWKEKTSQKNSACWDRIKIEGQDFLNYVLLYF